MEKNEKIYANSLILPIILFSIFGILESREPEAFFTQIAGIFAYPIGYSIKIILMGIAGLFLWKNWIQLFPLRFTRFSGLALGLGFLCTILWVLLAAVPVPNPLVTGEARAAFNPFEVQNGLTPVMAWGFWTVRMFGLALVVPIMEELFLRGFLLRWIQGENWLERSVGELNPTAWLVLCFYAVATHPEILAAIIWFSIVTLYVKRTGNFWDAVLFHIGTNAGLGLYVLFSGQWGLM